MILATSARGPRVGGAPARTLTPEETSAVQSPPLGTCCVPVPMVLELDPDGALVQAWGEWPVAGGPATDDYLASLG